MGSKNASSLLRDASQDFQPKIEIPQLLNIRMSQLKVKKRYDTSMFFYEDWYLIEQAARYKKLWHIFYSIFLTPLIDISICAKFLMLLSSKEL